MREVRVGTNAASMEVHCLLACSPRLAGATVLRCPTVRPDGTVFPGDSRLCKESMPVWLSRTAAEGSCVKHKGPRTQVCGGRQCLCQHWGRIPATASQAFLLPDFLGTRVNSCWLGCSSNRIHSSSAATLLIFLTERGRGKVS